MIAVVGALDAEIDAFLSHLKSSKSVVDGPFTFYRGQLKDREVVVTKSGVGKTLAAMTTQKVIDAFKPEMLLFTGIAGALNAQLSIGDLVVGTEYIQHDVDARSLGFSRGEIPYTGHRVIKADSKLTTAALSFRGESGKTFGGRILSGDQFITQSGKTSHGYLIEELRGDAIEMEGASVAFVCTLHNIPFVVLRTISDRANDDAAIDFQSFLPRASQQSLCAVEYLLESIGH